jgi:hypothetical protein
MSNYFKNINFLPLIQTTCVSLTCLGVWKNYHINKNSYFLQIHQNKNAGRSRSDDSGSSFE